MLYSRSGLSCSSVKCVATLGLAGAGILILPTWCFVLQKSPRMAGLLPLFWAVGMLPFVGPRTVAYPFEEVGQGCGLAWPVLKVGAQSRLVISTL